MFYAKYPMEKRSRISSEESKYVYLHRVAPIPGEFVQDFAEHGWSAYTKTEGGEVYAYAERKIPIHSNSLDGVDLDEIESERRRVVASKYVVGLAMELPVQPDDVVAISGLEKVLVESRQKSVRKERKEQTLPHVPITNITPGQQDVLRLMLRPREEIAEELHIGEATVVRQIQKIREGTGLTVTGMVLHGLQNNMVDVSNISPTSLRALTREQQVYIAEKGVDIRLNSKTWLELCELFGARNKYEVYAMAVRDGLIDLAVIIQKHAHPRQ